MNSKTYLNSSLVFSVITYLLIITAIFIYKTNGDYNQVFAILIIAALVPFGDRFIREDNNKRHKTVLRINLVALVIVILSAVLHYTTDFEVITYILFITGPFILITEKYIRNDELNKKS